MQVPINGCRYLWINVGTYECHACVGVGTCDDNFVMCLDSKDTLRDARKCILITLDNTTFDFLKVCCSKSAWKKISLQTFMQKNFLG